MYKKAGEELIRTEGGVPKVTSFYKQYKWKEMSAPYISP
jgi:hypothetical protein